MGKGIGPSPGQEIHGGGWRTADEASPSLEAAQSRARLRLRRPLECGRGLET